MNWRKLFGGIAIGLAAAAAVVITVIGVSKLPNGNENGMPPAAVSSDSLETGGEEIIDKGQETAKETKAPEAIPVSRLTTPEFPETTKYDTDNLFDEKTYDQIYAESRERMEYAKQLSDLDMSFYREALQEMIRDSEGSNPLCSPANMYLALAILAESSGGETQKQILDALHVSDLETLRKQIKALVLSNYVDDGLMNSHFANSVWLNSFIDYREDTLMLLRDEYFSSVFQGTMGDPQYDQALRDWINDETGAFLRDAVEGISMDPANAVELVSTLYLKAFWNTPFDPSRTEEGTFHGKSGNSTVSFMHTDMDTTYFYGEHFGAIRLYLNNNYYMWLLLPDEGVDVRDLAEDNQALSLLLNHGDSELYNSETWAQKNAWAIIHLTIPKFDLSAKNDLNESLQKMGITDAFSKDKADFSPLVETDQPVWVSKAENGIRVAIDENGVTAASYIDMALAGAAIPEDEVDFCLDRPFLFSITGAAGTPLFTGVIEN